MFSFLQWFLRHGFRSMFSYISWQVTLPMFMRLQKLFFVVIIFLLVCAIFI